ncbi:hypothetical protein AHAS_Ahas06G0051800 [Arachis hypogaea]
MVHPYQPYGGVLPIPFHLVQNGMAYFNYYPSIAGSKSYPQLSHVSPYSSGPSDSYTWVGLLNDAINNKKPEMNVAALDSCQEMVLIFIIPLRIARSSSHQIAHGDTTMFIVQDIDCIEAIAKDPQHFRQIVVFLMRCFDNSPTLCSLECFDNTRWEPYLDFASIMVQSGVDMDIQKGNIERDVFINQRKAKQTKT